MIQSIAVKTRCAGDMLRNWLRQVERDRGVRAGPTMDKRERINAMERENRDHRRTNEILRQASANFDTADFDRRSRP